MSLEPFFEMKRQLFYLCRLNAKPNFVKKERMSTATKPRLWKAFIMITVFLLFIPYDTAQADDDEEEIIDLMIDQTGTPVGRSLNVLRVSAAYLPNSQVVTVSFMDSFNEVKIKLTNVISGAYTTHVIDPAWGTCQVPVTLGEGMYLIEILLDGGLRVWGYYSVH